MIYDLGRGRRVRMIILKLRGEFEAFILSIDLVTDVAGLCHGGIVCGSAHGPQNNSRVIECDARVEPNDEYPIATFGTTTGIDPEDNVLVTGERFVVAHAVILPGYRNQ